MKKSLLYALLLMLLPVTLASAQENLLATITLKAKKGATVTAKFIGTTPQLKVDWGDGAWEDLVVSDEVPGDLADVKTFTKALPAQDPTIQIKGSGLLMLQMNRLWMGGDTPEMTHIDLSNAQDLEVLIVDNNKLTQLDVTPCPNLRILHCFGNLDLAVLDVSKAPGLTELYLQYTAVKDLDLSHNPLLKTLDLDKTAVEALDLSGNTQIQSLFVQQSPLRKLNLSGCTALYDLRVGGNKLESVILDNNPALTKLQVFENPLSELNFAACPNVEELYFDQTNIQHADLRGMARLRDLGADRCKLTYLRLHPQVPLSKCFIYGNQLDACALDSLFNELPATDTTRVILVQATKEYTNPGMATAKSFLAKDKGYLLWDDIDRVEVSGDGTGCRNDLSIADVLAAHPTQGRYLAVPTNAAERITVSGAPIRRLFVLDPSGATVLTRQGDIHTLELSALSPGRYLLLIEPVEGKAEVLLFNKI